jgi:hypothetical protein
MKLRRNELCAIHHSYFCCGRKKSQSRRNPWSPVRRIEDPHHPRGYRERRSPSEMRRLLQRKIAEQNSRCALCGREFKHFRDIVPDHIQPKGMGAARRDDHPDNVQAVHRRCNWRKGSKRPPRSPVDTKVLPPDSSPA